MAATTAPKPTRLATLSTGRTAALAPASMLARREGIRRPVTASSVRMPAASAVATAQTPATAESARPAPGRLRQELRVHPRQQDEGHQQIDQRRRRRAAGRQDRVSGGSGASSARWISAGSNSRDATARSRTTGRPRRHRPHRAARCRSPRRARRAAASCRRSHQSPMASMTADATTPRPGAAKGVVPKKGIGMVFGIAGVPGSADMVKVELPTMTAAGISRRGMSAARNSAAAIGRQHEVGDEKADAAIGDDGAGQHHGQHRTLRAQLLRHEAGDRPDGAAVLHQLAEQGAEQEQREELRHEPRGAAHEGLRPVRQQGLAGEGGGDQCGGRRQQQHRPATIGEPDKEHRGREGCRGGPRPHIPFQQRCRSRARSACRHRRHARSGIRRPPCGPRRAAWTGKPIRR